MPIAASTCSTAASSRRTAANAPRRNSRKAASTSSINVRSRKADARRGGLPPCAPMIQDLRFGLRMLAKSPAFTAIAVLSLALGIGANTAIFSLVHAALLKPIPVDAPERLATVFMTDQRNPGNLPLSHLNYKDLRAQNQVFTDMAAQTFAQVNWSRGTQAEQIPIQVVSGNYFSLLGARTP